MTTETTEKSGTTSGYVPRLLQRYRDEIKPALQSEFGYANPMLVPAWSRSRSTWVSARLRATRS